jgi:hypothetical protein
MIAKPITGDPSSRTRRGGAWPDLARTAARTLSGAAVEVDTTAAVQLLADLRDLFVVTAADKLATATMLRHLTTLDDRPWADYAQGQPITPRPLAHSWTGSGSRRGKFAWGPARSRGTCGPTSRTPSAVTSRVRNTETLSWHHRLSSSSKA